MFISSSDSRARARFPYWYSWRPACCRGAAVVHKQRTPRPPPPVPRSPVTPQVTMTTNRMAAVRLNLGLALVFLAACAAAPEGEVLISLGISHVPGPAAEIVPLMHTLVPELSTCC